MGVVRHRRALTACLLIVTLLAAAGCGNWITTDIIGVVGARMDRSGSVQLLLNDGCGRVFDNVLLFPPHTGPRTKPDRPIGIWRARTPFHRDTVLNINHPGPAWEVRRDPGSLQPGKLYVVEAASTTEDQELSQVSFTLGQLKSLRADEVHFYGRRVMKRSRFARVNWCSRN
jgi:hypothetical protein